MKYAIGSLGWHIMLDGKVINGHSMIQIKAKHYSSEMCQTYDNSSNTRQNARISKSEFEFTL